MDAVRQVEPSALFIILAIEEAGVYLPLPGNWLMAYAGVRAAELGAPWVGLFAAGVLATMVGASALFAAARLGGRPLVARVGPRLGLTEARVSRFEAQVGRYGVLAVFAGRLIPGIRCGSSFAAGVLGVSVPAFAIGTLAAAAVWWGFWLYLGWSLGAAVLTRLDRSAGDILVALGATGLIGIGLILARALRPFLYAVAGRSVAIALTLVRTSSSTRSR